MSSVHELVSCASSASVDVVFIPPEVLGHERGLAATQSAMHRAATLPEPAASRVTHWDSTVRPVLPTYPHTDEDSDANVNKRMRAAAPARCDRPKHGYGSAVAVSRPFISRAAWM